MQIDSSGSAPRYFGPIGPALRLDVSRPKAEEGGNLAVEFRVHVGFPVAFDKFGAPVSNHLRDGGGRPSGVVKFHFGISDQVAVLFEIVRHADQFVMPFDHQAVVAEHVEVDMEVELGLERLEQIVCLQKMFDGGLKQGGHGVLLGKNGRALVSAIRIKGYSCHPLI